MKSLSWTKTEKSADCGYPRRRSRFGRGAGLGATAALCVAAAGIAIAQTFDPAIPDALKAQLESKHTAAVAVGVVVNGRLVYARAFGNAGTGTTFAIGSITKMFTAVSIMQLASRGQLSLSDPVSKYVPEYTNFASMTIRQLMNHTSGIPNYLDEAVALGKNAATTTPSAILASIAARPLDFQPGTDWNYSNTGYVLLGQIVERISGLALAEYEKRNIFAPLGMSRTSAAPVAGNVPAQAFKGDPGNWSWYYADGDIFSNVADLARFDIALMAGTVLPRAFFEEMQQTVPYATLAPGLRDGQGVFVLEGRQIRIVSHHGGMAGFRADNEMVPAKDFAVVVLGNGSYDTTPIVRAALKAYVPSYSRERNLGPQLDYDPAPAVTSRAAALLAGASSGHLDRSQFEPLISIQLPTDEAMVKQFAPFGRFERLQFVSKVYVQAGLYYVYRAVFTHRTVALSIVIDKPGKVAAFSIT